MQQFRVDLWEKTEYNYPHAFGFMPNIRAYLHEEEVRPCLLTAPGGGYVCVSPTEGEIVAKHFYTLGWNVFVLTYTTNPTMSVPLKTQPLKDIARAVRLIRKNAAAYRIRPDHLAVCGFSAAGHLCASLCTHGQEAEEPREELRKISCRPDAAILSYPVITSGEFAHRDSFTALLGQNASEEELTHWSLEKQVTPDTPPTFLWQTATDELVPVENSYLYAQALHQAGVTYAHHVFSSGSHGLSTADEPWEAGEFGEPYTLEQINQILAQIENGNLSVSDEQKLIMKTIVSDTMPEDVPPRKANPEAAVWPSLADQWLRGLFR